MTPKISICIAVVVAALALAIPAFAMFPAPEGDGGEAGIAAVTGSGENAGGGYTSPKKPILMPE